MISIMDSRKGCTEPFTPMLAVKTTSRKLSFGSDFANEKKIAIVGFKLFIETRDVLRRRRLFSKLLYLCNEFEL
jgi:phage FluMu gp28-like protein